MVFSTASKSLIALPPAWRVSPLRRRMWQQLLAYLFLNWSPRVGWITDASTLSITTLGIVNAGTWLTIWWGSLCSYFNMLIVVVFHCCASVVKLSVVGLIVVAPDHYLAGTKPTDEKSPPLAESEPSVKGLRFYRFQSNLVKLGTKVESLLKKLWTI